MTIRMAAQPQVIEVEGVFDVAAARRLAAALAETAADVQIDLSHVREFHDCGVALLAQSIAARRSPTVVLGLHEHHLRLLRYLGIDAREDDAGVQLS